MSKIKFVPARPATTVPFADVGLGEVFNCDGGTYMRIFPGSGHNAVSLSDGSLTTFVKEARGIVPMKAEMTLKPEVK